MASLVLALLGLLLLVAAWSDLRKRRIPNALVFPSACLGLLLNVLLPEGNGFASTLPGAAGFQHALAGMGLGLGIFLPFYIIGAMGAGDVKLMAMVGAFLGPNGTIESIVAIFLVGGVLSLLVLVRKGALGLLFRNLKANLMLLLFRMTVPGTPQPVAAGETVGRLPFAVAIAAGAILYAVMARNGMLGALQILSIT
ncbi:prepilin peptidase [Herbaspirillum sp. HC18]|nr:prepilin peptidase [Herbaspirillum sp. HC18]